MRLNRRKFLQNEEGVWLLVMMKMKLIGWGQYCDRRWEEKYRPDFNRSYWRARAINRYFLGELR